MIIKGDLIIVENGETIALVSEKCKQSYLYCVTRGENGYAFVNSSSPYDLADKCRKSGFPRIYQQFSVDTNRVLSVISAYDEQGRATFVFPILKNGKPELRIETTYVNGWEADTYYGADR